MISISKYAQGKLIAGLVTWLAIGLLGISGQAAAQTAYTLSWHDAPILGTNVDYSMPGQLTVTTNTGNITIPNNGAQTGQTFFQINPTVWNGSHFYDPNVWVWAASGVNTDLQSTYRYVGNWSFLGNGLNLPYSIEFPHPTVWGGPGYAIEMLYSSIGEFWLEDVGMWQYTEAWTGISGPDLGATLGFTRNFEISTSAQIPEPASLALFGLALAGLAVARRRKSV